MGFSPDDVRIAVARRDAANGSVTTPVVEGWRDGVLTVFVPGRPSNPLNGGQRSYMKHARLRKEWRQRAAMRVWEVTGKGSVPPRDAVPLFDEGKARKRITFTVYGPSTFDSDNLEAVCKSARDSMKDCRVIQDDRPSAGHTFLYAQAKPTRKAGAIYGIAITVALA